MCKKSGESIEHLSLHCEVARDLWSYILTLFGVEWVMPRMVLELLTSWGASFGYGPAKEVWRLVPLCLMWCIWRERKSRVLWLREGDKCTKFFHTIANSNRRTNSIDSLLIGGSLSINQTKINVHISWFYL
jgi:hypothetical protein